MPSQSHPYKPHKTVRGRVVYDRRIHFFEISDIERISGAVIKQTDGDPGLLYQILEKINLFMLGKILSIFGLQEFKDVALQFLLNLVGQILAWLRATAGDLFTQEISHSMYMDLVQYLPERDRPVRVTSV